MTDQHAEGRRELTEAQVRRWIVSERLKGNITVADIEAGEELPWQEIRQLALMALRSLAPRLDAGKAESLNRSLKTEVDFKSAYVGNLEIERDALESRNAELEKSRNDWMQQYKAYRANTEIQLTQAQADKQAAMLRAARMGVAHGEGVLTEYGEEVAQSIVSRLLADEGKGEV